MMKFFGGRRFEISNFEKIFAPTKKFFFFFRDEIIFQRVVSRFWKTPKNFMFSFFDLPAFSGKIFLLEKHSRNFRLQRMKRLSGKKVDLKHEFFSDLLPGRKISHFGTALFLLLGEWLQFWNSHQSFFPNRWGFSRNPRMGIREKSNSESRILPSVLILILSRFFSTLKSCFLA